MKQVPVRGGLVAIVDDEDFALVRQFKWRPFKPQNVTYAVSQLSRQEARDRGCDRTIRMHNLIAAGVRVDHVNGDGLDNRRSNLRFATASQNGANARQREGQSRFRGVGLHQGKWRAYIYRFGKHTHLGYFASEVDAAQAFNQAATDVWGEFARLNDV